jgi:hypothetical protein
MVNISVDTKAFDKAMDEYMAFTKKSVAEVINAKAFFIARNAVLFTDKTPPTKIESELNAQSRDYAPTPLSVVIINSRQKKKGEKGLTGRKMGQAIKKMLAARRRAVNFLRSGWLPAIRILETAMKRGDIKFAKRYAPKNDSTVKQYGQDKGSAIWAKPNLERTYAQIENAVQGEGRGKVNTGRVQSIITKGLDKAIKAEIASMKVYVERKMNPATDKFNK